MGEYADMEIDRWIGDCRWGYRRPRSVPTKAQLREQQKMYQSRNPARPEDFEDLTLAK